jgi:multiple sugar transport system substrate-binding protein
MPLVIRQGGVHNEDEEMHIALASIVLGDLPITISKPHKTGVNKMKRLILIINLVLIGAMVIVSCATPTTEVTSPAAPATTEQPAPAETVPPASVEQPATSGKVKVTIFVGLGTGTDPEQITAENELADKFNSTHDNIEIEFLIVPYEQSREKLLSMISGGTAPQLVGPMGVETTAQFLDSLEDLTPYIQRDNYDTTDFYGPASTLNTYEGKNVGLPIGLYPSFIFYNVNAFDAAGVDYPTHDYNDKTWNIDKLREIAMQVTLDTNGNNATSPDFDPTNIAQYGLDDSWETLRGWAVLWAPANMGRPTSADYKTAIVNDPVWLKAIHWYSDAIWVDHFMPDAEAIASIDPENGDPFAMGNLAMWFCHTWYMSESLMDIGFKWDIAPVPFNSNGERIARVDADVYAIPKNATNKDEAWEVMKWLLQPDNNQLLCSIYGCMPARKSTEADYKANLEETYTGVDLEVIFEAATYLDVPNHESWVPEFGTINEALANAQSKLWTAGEDHDAQSVLDTTNAEIQKILDDYWSTH